MDALASVSSTEYTTGEREEEALSQLKKTGNDTDDAGGVARVVHCCAVGVAAREVSRIQLEQLHATVLT